MPIPNDLTAEEEAEFSAMGVAPAGQGVEPNGEPQQELPLEPAASPHADRTRDASGRFTATPEETAAGVDPNAAAPEAAEAAAPPPPGFVPHAALHAERMERQRVAAQFATLTARTNAMLARQQQETSQPAVMPSMQDDPVAYLQALEGRVERFERARQEETQYRQIDSSLERDEAAFKAVAPDYDQASHHYVMSRAQELAAFHEPEQIQQIMLTEVRQAAQAAWERGIPAAQLIYQMAQARGYQPGAAPAPTPQPAPPPAFTPAMLQQQPAPTAPRAGLTPQAAVAAAKTGMAASRTLSGQGGAPAGAMNAEALLAMSDEEFEAQFRFGTKGADARFANIG